MVVGSVFIVILMAWLSLNDSKEDNADPSSKSMSGARYDSSGKTVDNARRRPARRIEGGGLHVSNKSDRESPEKAFDTFVEYLRNRSFNGRHPEARIPKSKPSEHEEVHEKESRNWPSLISGLLSLVILGIIIKLYRGYPKL